MTQSPNLLLGIDTGGTYTDAALIDQRSHSITASAKAITSKGNLEVGIGEAMANVLSALPPGVERSAVKLVSVSTTLATNAIVEGHGSPVAAVLIGFDDAMVARTGIARAFPGLPIIRIAGGHDHNGDELVKLDVAALRQHCAATAHTVSAFSVASAFSVRNASHEWQARDAIVAETGLPVTLSTEIASALDAPRRAMTAVLNARLIGRISKLIEALRAAAANLGLDCPIMIVKGDGALANVDAIAARPIETVLSGPAASMIGAKWLSRLDDFVMSDMGGTTTDVGIMTAGRPRVAAEGASVGGWRTMVKAIDVETIGLGGDSEVTVGVDGAITIGPQRALPVSLLAHRRPETIAMLEADLAATEGGSLLGRFAVLPFGSGKPAGQDLTPREAELLSQIGEAPLPLRMIAVSSSAQRALQSLRRKGLVQVASFTPSDAAHVLRLQSNWNWQAAELAAKLSYRLHAMKLPDEGETRAFCGRIWSRTVALSARAVAETALGKAHAANPLVAAVCDGFPQQNLARIAITPTVPVIAVGGPVKVYYPEVAKRLGADVRFVENYDVANAVGAAAGLVSYTAEANLEGDGQGLFRVHCDGQTVMFTKGAEALSDAIAKAEASALARAQSRGAQSPTLRHSIEKHYLPDAQGEDGLVSARITAEATGSPISGAR